MCGGFCIGTNQIDLAECETRGIAVFNAPYSNTRSVVELSIGLMVLWKITHPPAGATTLLIMLTAPDWWFLFNPVLTGSVLMVLVAHYYHQSHRKGHQHLVKRKAAAANTKAED